MVLATQMMTKLSSSGDVAQMQGLLAAIRITKILGRVIQRRARLVTPVSVPPTKRYILVSISLLHIRRKQLKNSLDDVFAHEHSA